MVPDAVEEGMVNALRTAAGSVSAADRRAAPVAGSPVELAEDSGRAANVPSFWAPGSRGFGGISTVTSGSVLGPGPAELRRARFKSSANAAALW
jgi:hypothetical protein